MGKPMRSCQNIFQWWSLFGVLLVCAGCAHEDAQVKVFTEQTVKVSSNFEKRGYLDNAVEELMVANAVAPDNPVVLGELNRMVVKRNREAEKHFKAGLALRESDPRGARKELIEALKIHNDYPEAVAELKKIQLESAESVIQARSRREENLVAPRMQEKVEPTEEEEVESENYSLDIAISSFEKGNYDTAIREFGKMKARYPHDPDIQSYLDRSWYNSGISWFMKKEYRRALTSFSKVPKGFERVEDYLAKCRAALKAPQADKVKPSQKIRR
ncbi:MAG: hypothetical protein HXX11_11735 [Desulfuromonadales bacterium]|nr:hypothetical protein [Desulfuromonadales bacterium]